MSHDVEDVRRNASNVNHSLMEYIVSLPDAPKTNELANSKTNADAQTQQPPPTAIKGSREIETPERRESGPASRPRKIASPEPDAEHKLQIETPLDQPLEERSQSPKQSADLDYEAAVNALTLQFLNEHEATRVAALAWLIMLHRKAPRKILAIHDGTFPAPKGIKILCLEEIGTGWLIQTVNCDHDAANSILGMGTPNAAGEQVDLLNTPEATMDVDPYSESDDEEDGNVMTDIDNGPVTRASQLRSTLKPTNYRAHLRTIWESEQNPRVHARRDDLQIQEQALDFIRNLINGDDNEAMIQHLNEILGASRLFDMLHRKLRPTIIANQAASNGNSSNRRFSPASSSASQRRTEIYQPPEIILSTIHIIAHLAAGPPAYKQLFIAQHALIKAWAQHFNHASARIRVQCVYGVISLTWIENQEDRPDAMRRAQELRVAGIEDKVRALSGDSDIDIREKVKMAVSQFDDLLGVR
ncbi:hypothetical protein LTR28_009526 [Elasticomyces elasticus]|nr:hypothetical protein LTR28_009526 [Elasticomyces elasticus]